MRVLRSGGVGSVHTSSTVFAPAVDVEIQPDVEVVLMDHRVDPRRDQLAMRGVVVRGDRPVDSTPVSLTS